MSEIMVASQNFCGEKDHAMLISPLWKYATLFKIQWISRYSHIGNILAIGCMLGNPFIVQSGKIIYGLESLSDIKVYTIGSKASIKSWVS